MNYDISYIPTKKEENSKPSNPIISDKLDINKVNELIDEKLNTFKEELVDKEELKKFIETFLQNQDFQNKIKVSTTPPTYNSEAKIGELWAVLANKKQLFVCTFKDDNFTSWINLLGDGSDDIIPEEKIIITFDNTTTTGQYGGCMSDLRLGFDNGFATPNKVQDEYENAKFTITKDGNGLKKSDFILDSNPIAGENQILGIIKTSGIYPESYHKIAHVFKKYNGSADECCLWHVAGTREVIIELQSSQMPNKLFARGNGYYGQTQITNVRAKKVIFIGGEEIQSQDFNVEKLETNTDTYGEYGFLFEISEQNEEQLEQRKTKKTRTQKKSNKE